MDENVGMNEGRQGFPVLKPENDFKQVEINQKF